MDSKTFIPITCLAIAVILAGVVNMQQDTEIKALTERVIQLELTK